MCKNLHLYLSNFRDVYEVAIFGKKMFDICNFYTIAFLPPFEYVMLFFSGICKTSVNDLFNLYRFKQVLLLLLHVTNKIRFCNVCKKFLKKQKN